MFIYPWDYFYMSMNLQCNLIYAMIYFIEIIVKIIKRNITINSCKYIIIKNTLKVDIQLWTDIHNKQIVNVAQKHSLRLIYLVIASLLLNLKYMEIVFSIYTAPRIFLPGVTYNDVL